MLNIKSLGIIFKPIKLKNGWKDKSKKDAKSYGNANTPLKNNSNNKMLNNSDNTEINFIKNTFYG